MARSHTVGRSLLTGLAGLALLAPALGAGATTPGGPPTQGSLGIPAPVTTDDEPATVAAEVTAELDSQGQADFWIDLSAQADLSPAYDIEDWQERGEFVYQALTSTAEQSQAAVRAELDAAGVSYETFWVSNAIQVQDGDADLVASLADQPGVTQIVAPVELEVPDIELELPEADQTQAETAAVAWNLKDINANDAWAEGVTGEGIIVANIDTGVQWDHPSLKRHYRGFQKGQVNHNYHWFDPAAGKRAPYDTVGHGTHVMGTMVGSDGGQNRIGVAPGAEWIAARGCVGERTCRQSDLLAAGQWTLAPTNLNGKHPRPGQRPHIINNSWGQRSNPVNDPFFGDVADAWAAAGQFAVFANGNYGPSCGTSTVEGRQAANYSVGNYRQDHLIAEDSSRGPSTDGQVKPDISAPGSNIRSAYYDADTQKFGYALGDGTSFAAPHVAGAVALLWSAHPDLRGDVEVTRGLLGGSAVDTEDTSCGGTAANNNVFGQGRLDAFALLQAAPDTPVRRLAGQDRYATAAAIAASHSAGVNTVYLATGKDYPDALVGAALAGSQAAPVLLTKHDTLPSATREELTRLAPQHVVLLGGGQVISPQVGRQVRQLTGASTQRMAGANRYNTAARIADGFKDAEVVYIATGENYPDALAGAARAGALDGPVLLTKPEHLPRATGQDLRRLTPDRIVVLGGSTAVSQAVEAQLAQYAPVTRVAGSDRYDTAAKISQDYDSSAMVYIATGDDWPDALAGAARAGRDSAPVLLVQNDNIPRATHAQVQRLDPTMIYVLGGHSAISTSVEILLGRIE